MRHHPLFAAKTVLQVAVELESVDKKQHIETIQEENWKLKQYYRSFLRCVNFQLQFC